MGPVYQRLFIILMILSLLVILIDIKYFAIISANSGLGNSFSTIYKHIIERDENSTNYMVPNTADADFRVSNKICKMKNATQAVEKFTKSYELVKQSIKPIKFRFWSLPDPIVRVRGYDHYFILNPQKKLFLNGVQESASSVDSILLLNIVAVSVGDFKTRLMIRNSWGNPKAYQSRNLTRTVFVCGRSSDQEINKQLRYESAMYNDIIQADFKDTYENLTLKTLLALKWVTSYYNASTLKFILKLDDDIVPTMSNLLPYLNELAIKKTDGSMNSFLGWVGRNATPIRLNSSKHYLSEEEYKDSILPTFCAGSAYIITTDLAIRISQEDQHEDFLKLEDVYVTGIIGNRLGASYIDLSSKYFPLINTVFLPPNPNSMETPGYPSQSFFTLSIKDSYIYLLVWCDLIKGNTQFPKNE